MEIIQNGKKRNYQFTIRVELSVSIYRSYCLAGSDATAILVNNSRTILFFFYVEFAHTK
jgi:hypothetical protein